MQSPDGSVPSGEPAIGPMLAARFKAFGANTKHSIFQLVTTGMAFVALLVVMAVASRGHYWLTLLLAVPTAGLLVRLFIIQHDCGHGSFFALRSANDRLGRALSLLTLTPYGSWKLGHAIHHASTGNLDRRGRGDVDTMTVAEYRAVRAAQAAWIPALPQSLRHGADRRAPHVYRAESIADRERVGRAQAP